MLKTRSEEEQRRSFVVRSERKFYCIDSIECKVQNQNKNLLILIDRSNTMDQVVGSGNKKKIEIEKQVVTKFIQNALNREDSVALIFFNTEYELIPWTNDKSLIIDKVSKLEPKGNTLLYKYILKSLEYLSSFPKKNKALVVFTDGINQPPYFDSSSTFENIISKIGQYYGISIYFVVIPSNPSPDRNRALQRLWEIKSTHTNSIIYTPNDILELERDVSKIVEDYSYNLCCSIVLEIPNPCLGKTANEVVFVDLLYSPIEKDTILLFRIPIRCSKVFLESMQNCLIIKEFDKSLQSEENYYFIEYGFLNFGYSPITINGISSKINNLSISEELPFQIPPHEIKRLKFSFPFSTNHILDTLKIFKNSSCGDSIIIFDFFINDEETSSGIFENNSTKHKRFDNLFVNLFPNPASKVEEVNVNINVSEGKVVTFDIYDFKGELLNSKEFIPNYSGIHAIKLNTKGFTNGIYFLLIKYEGNFELKPFLIKD
ncbi:MAG: VWA domain-containing protein [Candidatus Kapaibacteriota bacterium]